MALTGQRRSSRVWVRGLLDPLLPNDLSADNPLIALLPYPSAITVGDERLCFAGDVSVDYADVRSERLEGAVARFRGALERVAGKRDAACGVTTPLQIVCSTTAAEFPQYGDAEGYRLSVDAGGIVLSASCEWGVLHGLTTLAQLLLAGEHAPACEIPFCEIDDEPRLAWRGVLIDVARHFITLPALQRTLEGMAQCKLNVLHLHLTDDQAFRFPSRQFRRLASTEHFAHGELVELVRYAADRGVRVVPEIDMPGHTSSWLVAYPEWGTGQTAATRRFGVHEACLDPSNDSVYASLEVLLGEVAEVFPDHYLHIGGDEVHSAWWSDSADIERFMADQGIADVAGLQAYFIARIAGIAARFGKTIVGWDEVLHPDLDTSAVVQSWRGAAARDRALVQGNDCVVSAPYYLDLFYPAELHYRFDPEADEATLTALEDALLIDPRFAHVADGMRWTHSWRELGGHAGAGTGHVIGAEACLWGELVSDPLLDVRLWSRLPALAERFWSPAAVTDIDELYLRLENCFKRLALLSDIDIFANSRRLIADAGVTAAWWPLVDVLEPVKWYGRLLGERALAARLDGTEMPQARPYDMDTPLNRVVDGMLPESLVARTVAALCRRHVAGDKEAAAELGRFAESWQSLAGQSGCVAELVESADKLQALGSMVIRVLDGSLDRDSALQVLDAATPPQGEYLIAVVPPLRSWVEASEP